MKKFVKITISVLLLVALGTAAALGYFEYRRYLSELPEIDGIADFSPSVISTVYSSDGEIIGEFGIQKRRPAKLVEIPKLMKEAVLAVEDTDFYYHRGVNVKGMLRAFLENIKEGRIVQGGSTITQQLARDLYLTKEQSWSRKIKEAFLALEIERRLLKDQILEMYLNQIYFGKGAYGVKEAAHQYFSKSLDELSLGECALLAGVPKSPSHFAPHLNLEGALKRRRTVLDRMVEAGFISENQARNAAEEKITLDEPENPNKKKAPYFLEYIRQKLEQSYGTHAVHHEGLQVYTTLDYKLQKAAEEAVRWNLLEITKRRGLRKLKLEEKPVEELPDDVAAGTILTGRAEQIGQEDIKVTFAGETITVNPEEEGWTFSGKLSDYYAEGDPIQIQVLEIVQNDDDEEKIAFNCRLYQEPEIEGALLSMEVGTGEIKAWVGGYDFEKSKFDKVYQARRQPGSAFKPFIYAAALDTQFTAADIIYDSPIVEEMVKEEEESADKLKEILNQEEGEEIIVEEEEPEYWKPVNYSEKFHGATTIRTGLEKSRNLVTIKLLAKTGVRTAIRYARRCGIKSPLDQDLSLALGSSGVSLIELTSAYGVFADQGCWTAPMAIKKIIDRNGRILEEKLPVSRKAMDPAVSGLVSLLLQGVVENGTGWRAKMIGRPSGGKTGTTNEYHDAWYMGFIPQLVTGVWVGFNELKKIGPHETGSKAASPAWVRYMKTAVQDLPVEEFPTPEGLVFAAIDSETGLLAGDDSDKVIMEAFLKGTEPTRIAGYRKIREEDFFSIDSNWEQIAEDTEQEKKREQKRTYSSD